MSKTFQIVYEAAPEGGYTAFVPALPGCVSEGDTFEDATKNIREAVELYLETLKERGEELPEMNDTIVGNLDIEVAHA